jgi:hypothetical protein
MADVLTAAADRVSDGVVIVLTGNLHGSKKPSARSGSYPWMAMLLPSGGISLLVTDKGGEAWIQTSDGCGPHKMGSTGGDVRGIVLGESLAAQRGYDGALSIGSYTTASLPAIPGAPQAPACSQ